MQPALMENLQLALRPPPVLPVDPCSLAVGFLPRRRRIPPPSAPRRAAAAAAAVSALAAAQFYF